MSVRHHCPNFIPQHGFMPTPHYSCFIRCGMLALCTLWRSSKWKGVHLNKLRLFRWPLEYDNAWDLCAAVKRVVPVINEIRSHAHVYSEPHLRWSLRVM